MEIQKIILFFFLPNQLEMILNLKMILLIKIFWILMIMESITSVYSSHYGTSNIRALLKEIENNSSLFSEEEKSFILPTTFKNYDIKNHTDYTLTDKLYLASGKFTESEIQNQIYVGSDDSLQIAHAFYENNSSFWLRTPYFNDLFIHAYALYYLKNTNKINFNSVPNPFSLEPAFDLDLSSLRFASSIPATNGSTSKGTLDTDAGMTLRFDGKEKITASMKLEDKTVSIDNIDISVPDNNRSCLVIQGKDGNKEWYNSQVLNRETEIISLKHLKDTNSLDNDPEISELKIWIEKTENGITYAKMLGDDTIPTPTEYEIIKSNTEHGSFTVHNDSAEINRSVSGAPIYISPVPDTDYEIDSLSVTKTGDSNTKVNVTPPTEGSNDYTFTMPDYPVTVSVTFKEKEGPAPTEISNVEITDITPPSPGNPLDYTASCTTEGVETTTPSVSYTIAKDAASGNADFNKTYTANITLSAKNGYVFAENISIADVTVNGEPASSVTLKDNQTLKVTYDFITEKAKLISITQPENVSGLVNGTPKTAEALRLPSSVTIETQDPSVTRAEVIWDLNSASYDPAILTEQNFQVNGTVILPEHISNTDNLPLNVTIHVSVLPEGMIGMPQANIPSGIYTENQNIILSCDTEGAVIYYTTDGSIPNTSSAVYNGEITVSGTAGSSVTTVIHAIAIKEDQQSETSVFTYTINIPGEHVHNWDTSWTSDENAH